MSAFVVTTSIRGATKTQVWESSKPLALGHPFRWVLERTDNGVRLRNLGGALERIETNAVRELSHAQIQSGTEIDIAPYKLKIRPVVHAPAAFESGGAGDSSARGSTLMVYQCLDRWLIESRRAGDEYSPKYRQGKAPFQLRKSSAGYTLKASAAGLHLHGSQEKSLNDGETIELSLEQLSRSTLSFNAQDSESSMVWRFSLVDAPEFKDQAAEKSLIELEDAAWFKKAIQGTAIAFVGLIALSWLWPAPKDDPKVLIPEQYAKIVMAPTPKKAAPAASSDAGMPAAAAAAPKKVQDAAVVQAFRAKALTSAVNGLLKGGMTKLLAQSDFATGTTQAAEARKLFDSKNTALKTAAPGGAMGNQNVAVASLGGDAKGIAGSAVGYGKGDRASVKGQGKGFTPFVSADANGSMVDEGLTKDEVGEVIHRHLSEVRYCYESAMIRTPDIEGKLMTNFTINGQGVVKSAEVKSSTLPDPRLDDCIIRRLATWKFPKPRGGVDVAVTYPFIFKTLGR